MNNWFSMKKNGKKNHDGYPILISILLIYAKFHHNLMSNKEFFFILGVRPLKRIQADVAEGSRLE